MLKATHRWAGDKFGYSISITTDRLAVGVPYEDSDGREINVAPNNWTGATDSGAVYVFDRVGTTWTANTYIKASNSVAGNMFGFSIKVAGQYLAVGAPYEDSPCVGLSTNDPCQQSLTKVSNSGAVYVFTHNTGVWQQADKGYLKASNPSTNSYFGWSLDGGVSAVSTLIVGAPGESSDYTGIKYNSFATSNTNAPLSGAAYIFIKDEINNTDRRQLAYLKASNTDAADQFGMAVASNGDIFAVGAPYEEGNGTGVNCSGNCQQDNSVEEAGAVYTFY